jgi:hypothetical protein
VYVGSTVHLFPVQLKNSPEFPTMAKLMITVITNYICGSQKIFRWTPASQFRNLEMPKNNNP